MPRLLASKSYKMPESQELNFASGRFVPPYLLEFQGTVGERHVENLQVSLSLMLSSSS